VLLAGCGYSWIMSGRVQKLLGEALDLTDEERAEVALELVASLDGPKDADAEDAWIVEIERRARRVLADSDGGEDWSAARAEIESKLRRP
jgi:Putative addiction module component